MVELYNENCITILKTIKSESIDCIVSDVPYRISGGGGILSKLNPIYLKKPRWNLTGEASIKNNRNFIGIEIDEKYYSIADKILNKGVSRESLRSKPTRKVITCDNIAMSIEEFLQC